MVLSVVPELNQIWWPSHNLGCYSVLSCLSIGEEKNPDL